MERSRLIVLPAGRYEVESNGALATPLSMFRVVILFPVLLRPSLRFPRLLLFLLLALQVLFHRVRMRQVLPGTRVGEGNSGDGNRLAEND